ncbi:MAG: hypothetical protein U5K77_04130 [Candidatus Saccharibacteria bacterium]|nr:hypothetical protein [Candidatus Saccharibacteria bacterium]
MTATNHVLTGAVLAAAYPNPLVVLPAALVSHVILDALPHYGHEDHTDRKFLYVLAVDFAIASSFLLSVSFLRPEHWLLIIAASVVAASPDALWLPHWLREITGKPGKAKSKLETFLARIQWAEKPWGWIFEIPWAIAAFVLFVNLSH